MADEQALVKYEPKQDNLMVRDNLADCLTSVGITTIDDQLEAARTELDLQREVHLSRLESDWGKKPWYVRWSRKRKKRFFENQPSTTALRLYESQAKVGGTLNELAGYLNEVLEAFHDLQNDWQETVQRAESLEKELQEMTELEMTGVPEIQDLDEYIAAFRGYTSMSADRKEQLYDSLRELHDGHLPDLEQENVRSELVTELGSAQDRLKQQVIRVATEREAKELMFENASQRYIKIREDAQQLYELFRLGLKYATQLKDQFDCLGKEKKRKNLAQNIMRAIQEADALCSEADSLRETARVATADMLEDVMHLDEAYEELKR